MAAQTADEKRLARAQADADGSGQVDLNEYDKYRLQDAMAHRERSALVDQNMQSITDGGDGDDKIDFEE